jgi:hypothetical protein
MRGKLVMMNLGGDGKRLAKWRAVMNAAQQIR